MLQAKLDRAGSTGDSRSSASLWIIWDPRETGVLKPPLNLSQLILLHGMKLLLFKIIEIKRTKKKKKIQMPKMHTLLPAQFQVFLMKLDSVHRSYMNINLSGPTSINGMAQPTQKVVLNRSGPVHS